MSEAFDLSVYGGLEEKQESGAELVITHPETGEPTSIVLTIAGPDSKTRKKADARIINDRLKLRVRKVSGELLQQEGIQLLAGVIIAWRGVVENGKDIEYSPQNAASLLTRFGFIKEQVDQFCGDRANFLKA